MKTSLTQLILEKRANKFISFIDYVPSFIANTFSVLFASTIVLELRGTVENYVLCILCSFVVLFLVWNEVTKVKEVRRFFKGIKNSIYPIIVTFVISISLASIGVYFFTNKSITITNDSTIQKSIEISEINNKYQLKKSDIQGIQFELSSEYDALNKELRYWKTRSALDIQERSEIRNKVAQIQTQIQNSMDMFNSNKIVQINALNDLLQQEIQIVNNKYNRTISNTKKNNFITYIFLILIIITEISTILLNKKIAEKLVERDNFLNSKLVNEYLLARRFWIASYNVRSKSTNMITLNKAKNSIIGIKFDTAKNFYNNFINIGILEGFKEVMMNKILVEESQGLAIIDSYYEKLFSI
jgi:hypothetical protein